jgi:protein-arginine kinase activator protein McsA
MKVATEMNQRLAEKADTRDVERSIPQKVDEVYRNILSQMNSLNKDLGRTVTKDEFHQLLAAKVRSFIRLLLLTHNIG